MPLLTDVEMPLIEVLAAMERVGIRVDGERLRKISAEMGDEAQRLESEIHERRRPRVHDRLAAAALAGALRRARPDARSAAARPASRPTPGCSPRSATSTRSSRAIERWRELTKLKNTYLDSLPELIDDETGRIHTTFNQVATTTGRLSSTNPNLQNIPIRSEIGRPVRAAFVAEPGMRLLSADYNQVELRVLAQVADEPVLREIFESGQDVHAATAAELLDADPDAVTPGERSKAKMVNYGIAYGLSAFGLADRLQIDQDEAGAYIDRYFERFPAVKRVHRRDDRERHRRGLRHDADGPPPPDPRAARAPAPDAPARRAPRGQHRDPGHRRRHHQARDDQRATARSATEGLETRLVLQIHDELLFEGPEAEMEAATRARRARDDRRLRPRPRARGGHRRRRGLAGREVAALHEPGWVGRDQAAPAPDHLRRGVRELSPANAAPRSQQSGRASLRDADRARSSHGPSELRSRRSLRSARERPQEVDLVAKQGRVSPPGWVGGGSGRAGGSRRSSFVACCVSIGRLGGSIFVR